MRSIHSIAAVFVLPVLASIPALADDSISDNAQPSVIVSTDREPVAPGPFQPTWDSLAQYKTPDWYRRAKFGIWAHWGPQCEPERGDWYARLMYQQGSDQNKFHVEHYGPPSEFGFKDVIHEWKAENWNPRELLALYKRAGAQYFVALANHHDNFDLWNSQYHNWNATKIGPQKDLIAGWAAAAREQGLRFGVSVHATHAWTFYEPSQTSDKTGPLAGVIYDGKLTAADGKGKWWDGLDPQELYAQRHPLSASLDTTQTWNWGGGVAPPDAAYCQSFYDRTCDLIREAHPDLVYFDDTALPLWPRSDAGLKIAANYYNRNIADHHGQLEAVLTGKSLSPDQRRCMVLDIERGQSDHIEPQTWQTDTCIGNWHYDRRIYDHNGYKSAGQVLATLADVVSKNGNLQLSVPVRADGTIDEKERAIVEQIAAWMQINREAIFDTGPWKVCGEGPQLEAAATTKSTNFNESKRKPAVPEDVRYTAAGNTIYAITLLAPDGDMVLRAMVADQNRVMKVQQLGGGERYFDLHKDGLHIVPDLSAVKDAWAPVVFKLTLRS